MNAGRKSTLELERQNLPRSRCQHKGESTDRLSERSPAGVSYPVSCLENNKLHQIQKTMQKNILVVRNVLVVHSFFQAFHVVTKP